MTDVFDENELMEHVDGDLEFLEETIEMLDEDSPPLLDQIRSAVEAKDAAALTQASHALKGVLGNFFASAAVAAAFDLERMGRDGNLESAAPGVERVTRETERVREALHAFLRTKKT